MPPPEIILRVRFLTTEEGGRNGGVLGPLYRLPMLIDGELFTCKLAIGDRELALGLTYEIPVKFLCPELVMPKLFVGKEIHLKSIWILATGEVIGILV